MKEMNKTKKINLIVLSVFLVLIVVCVVIIGVRKMQSNKAETNTTIPTTVTEAPVTAETQTAPPATQPQATQKPSEPQKLEEVKGDIVTQDALFIGDSRTVGIAEYANIKGADFFCDVGMSVYNIPKKTLSVEGVGKVSLDELLSNKQYKKVYIMLGINEVGYNMNTTQNKYKELVDTVLAKQPNAVVFVQANLHVTKERSEQDGVVNNQKINELNQKIKALADGKRVFYLDANSVFDDGNGNLADDKTGDKAHLYAKYYKAWGAWIVEESNKMV